MAGGGAGADALLDASHQGGVQDGARAQHHEQDDAQVAVPLLTHADGVRHLFDALHLAVDFRGADAHPAGVEHRVAAPVDDIAALFGLLGEVPMRPDAGKLAEVGAAELFAVRVPPEADGAGGEGAGADQFALFADGDRLAGFAPNLHRHAQPLALQLPGVNRQVGVAEDEAGDQVGAAGHGDDRHVLLDGLTDVAKALLGERSAGGEQAAQRL